MNEIIENIKQKHSQSEVRSLFNKLSNKYDEIQSNIKILGCDKHGKVATTVMLSIPSQSNLNKQHTVIIWADTQSKIELATPIKVYNTSPSFLFRYAYMFYKRESLLFPKRIPEEFIKIAPKNRDISVIDGLDSHIYFAIRYISDQQLPAIIKAYHRKTTPAIPRVRFVKNPTTGKTTLEV